MLDNTVLNPLASPSQLNTISPKTNKDWVEFFLDPKVNRECKTEYAETYVLSLFDQLNTTHLSWIDQVDQVRQHIQHEHDQTCSKFQSYLDQRKSGLGRDYFPTISHALEFLYKVAPVKYVDGSWLYSSLTHPSLFESKDLSYIYLEELGLGDAKANHVCMYHSLLRHFELEPYINYLDDIYFEQAAVQLALAYIPHDLFPLVIGFNLGYEQLPLHLLITNYELAELGIDPHYFNVHITIDNAHNGHAEKSIQAFIDHYHQAQDKSKYLELVKMGFQMNDLGLSSTNIIQEIDLTQSVYQLLQRKAVVGQHIHNQKCQFNGRSINEWLAQPELISEFIQILIDKQWIIKNRPVEESRFWKLIHDSDGKMFGVFNATEKMLIKDWIQGESLTVRLKRMPVTGDQNWLSKYNNQHELEQIKHQCDSLDDTNDKLALLIPYLSPYYHPRAIGLWATQEVSKILFPFQTLAL